MAYHARQGIVERWQRQGLGIAFTETRAYVSGVERFRRVYPGDYPRELGR